MTGSAATRYLMLSGASALAAGAVAVAVLWSGEGGKIPWFLLGWSIMSVIGVLGGVRLVVVHGRPGSAFLAALVASILSRLFASALGAGAAVWSGGTAVWPYILGLAVGFLPPQIFEVVWFAGQTRAES